MFSYPTRFFELKTLLKIISFVLLPYFISSSILTPLERLNIFHTIIKCPHLSDLRRFLPVKNNF